MTTPLNPYEQQRIIQGLRAKVGALERWRKDLTPGVAGLLRDARGPGGGGGSTPSIDTLLSSILSAPGDVLYWDGSAGQALPLGATNEVLTAASGAPQWTSDLRDIDSIGNSSTVPAGNLLDFQDAGLNRGAALGNWWVGNFDIFPGVAHLGFYGLTKGNFYSHALIQTIGGATALNAAAGQTLSLTLNGGTALAVGVDVFLATATLGTFGVPIQLQNGTSINEFSTDATLAGNSNDAVPTEQAVKTYVDNATKMAAVSYSGDATIPTGDYIASCDTSAKPFTITLPVAADYPGTRVVIYRDDPSNGTVLTIAAQGADRIRGLTTDSLNRAYDTRVYYSNGTDWAHE